MNLRVSVVIISLVFSGVVKSENLLDIYKLAFENDATFQAAKYQYAAQKEALPQARAGLLPDFAFEAEYIDTQQDIVSSDNTVLGEGQSDFSTTNLTLSLTQPVFRYSSWIGYQQSKVVVNQAETELLVVQQQLIIDAADRYFAVLFAKDSLEFARAEKASVGKHLEFAKSRTKTGLARMTDLYDAEARYSLSEAREIEAENILDDSYQALQELTGKYITQLNSVKENMPLVDPDPADADEWINKALQQNLTLEAGNQSVEIAKQEVKRQNGGHIPTLDLVATGNRRDSDGSLFGGGSEVETLDLLLRFNLPIYQGGGVQSRKRAAINDHQKVIQELEAARRQVRRDTKAAYLGVLSGIKQVEAFKKSITAQEQTLEVKRAGVRAGVNTMIEVLDAERDLYFKQRDYSRTRYDYLLSTLKLKQAIGTLSVTDLNEINRFIN